MRQIQQLFSIACLCCTLCACGTKGPLYLPKPSPAPSAPATKAPAVDDSTGQGPVR